MPPKRRAPKPKGDAPKPAEEKDEASADPQVSEKKSRKGKQAEKLEEPVSEEAVPEVAKSRKGKQAEKLDNPSSEDDIPEVKRAKKGRQAEKLDDSSSEQDMPEVPKGKKGKKAKKLDDPSSEDDVPTVKRAGKGRQSERFNDPLSEEAVLEVPKSRKRKQAEKLDDPLSEEEEEVTPEIPRARKGRHAERFNDPLSDEDAPEVPKVIKGKKAEKLDDPLSEDNIHEVPKAKKGKQAEKLDDPLSDGDLSDVPVKKSKKGKESKQAKKPNDKVEAKAKLPAKKRGAAKQVENSDEEIIEPADKQATKRQLESEASNATDEVPAKKKRGAAKQADKPDTKDVVEELPARQKRGAAIAAKQRIEDQELVENTVAKKKQATKAATKAAPLNKTETKWDDINFDSDKKNKEGKTHNLKITSWNVDGIRSWLNKEGLSIINHNKPDIFCLQETRCSDEKLPEEVTKIDDYHVYWCPSQKDGYAGVGVYSKIVPLKIINGIGNDDHDDEGRCITCEYDGFYLVNVYVPNAGRGLKTLPKRLEWNELFKAYIKKLDEKKPVIVCGDMNVAHNEIDLSNPKSNKKNAGFTQEERDGMTDFLKDGGFVDTFRELYPEEKDVYTFWSYMSKARVKNVGWRLDYFIVSKRIIEKVCDNVVNKDVFGSDHCPITLFINI